jgi:hypothetical protein
MRSWNRDYQVKEDRWINDDFIICTHPQIILGRSNEGDSDGPGM